MKTLGQIAREAFDATPCDNGRTFDHQEHLWEAAAQAVRVAVFEEIDQEALRFVAEALGQMDKEQMDGVDIDAVHKRQA